MWALKAFVLGAVAVGALAYALVAMLALTAQAGGKALDVALGPILLVAVGDDRGATVTSFGPGLLLAALAGGVANLAAALALRRRSGSRAGHID